MKKVCLKKNNMKLIHLILLCLLPILFIGCEAIGDIFKAGIWVGIIIVIAIIAIVAFIISLFRK
jgi:hypothetical protein